MSKLDNGQAESPYSLKVYSGHLPAHLRPGVVLCVSYYYLTPCIQVYELSQTHCGDNWEGTTLFSHFHEISNISILTNLQRTVTIKKCEKVYTN